MSNIYYVADYCRFSSKEDDTKESNSIVSQRAINKDFIAALQKKYPDDTFIHVDSYSDDDYTGTNFNRPDFKRLKADCLSGRINCIVVKDHSRFGRNAARMTIILEDDLEDVRYISILDNFDSRYDDYDSMFQIRSTFNQMYAEDISRKIHSSVDSKQKAGKFIGSFCSYGYIKSKADKNKLEIDPDASCVVKMIFNLRLQGMNIQTIARRLNSLGIPSPTVYKHMQGLNFSNNRSLNTDTQLWTFSTVYSILTKETYMGNLVQGRVTQKMRKKQKKKPKDEWVIAKGAVPAIVSEETFLEVQRLMKQANYIRTDNKNETALFSGFVKCGECSHSMTKAQKADETLYYACRTRKAQGKKYCDNDYIRSDVLEKIVLDDLNTIIAEITDLYSLIDTSAINTQKTSLENQLSKLKFECDKTIRKRRMSYSDYQDELISKNDYIAFKEDLEQKEQSLNMQIETVQTKLDNLDLNSGPSPFIQTLLDTRKIETLDRSILQEMIEQIYVYKDNRIKIIYKFANDVEALRQITNTQ